MIVEMACSEGSPDRAINNPQRCGIVADISLEELFTVYTRDSDVTTVTIKCYTLFPSPRFSVCF